MKIHKNYAPFGLKLTEQRLIRHNAPLDSFSAGEPSESENEKPSHKYSFASKPPPRVSKEKQGQQEKTDQKIAQNILESIESNDTHQLILKKVLETKDTNEKNALLLQLIISLLTQAQSVNVSRTRLTDALAFNETPPDDDTVPSHDPTNNIQSANIRAQAKIPRDTHVYEEALASVSRSKDEAQRKIHHWNIVSQALEGGTTAQEFREEQEGIIDECDAQLESGNISSSQNTIKRKKNEAQQNIAMLNEMQSFRIAQVAEFNQTYNLRKILKDMPAEERNLNPFWDAEFGLDGHLNIVLKNIKYDFTKYADASSTYHFGGGKPPIDQIPWIPDLTGVYVTGGTVEIKLGAHMKGLDTLTFRKSQNGTYVLSMYHGDYRGDIKVKDKPVREWQRKIRSMSESTQDIEQRKFQESLASRNEGEQTEYLGPLSKEILQKARASSIHAARAMVQEMASRNIPPQSRNNASLSYGPASPESKETYFARNTLHFLSMLEISSSSDGYKGDLDYLNHLRGQLGLQPIIIIERRR